MFNNVFLKKNNQYFLFKSEGLFANELVDLGFKVELLQTKLDITEGFHNFAINEQKIKVTALKRYSSKILTYCNAYFIAILRILKNDFVYIYYPTNYHFLCFFCILFRKKYGLYVRGERGIRNPISKIIYKYSTFVFTVSPQFTDMIKTFGGNAFTQKPSISFDTNDIIRFKNLTFKKHYHILFLGRIFADKGVFDLVDAMMLLKTNSKHSFTLSFIGDGFDLDELKLYVKTKNLNNVINFEGHIEDTVNLREMYIKSDLFVLPSHHEGFPRTLYEAMIFGVPIITTFVGGIGSLMKDGYNCLEVKKKDPISIFESINYALNNYEKLDFLVKNGTHTVTQVLNRFRFTHAEYLCFLLKN